MLKHIRVHLVTFKASPPSLPQYSVCTQSTEQWCHKNCPPLIVLYP